MEVRLSWFTTPVLAWGQSFQNNSPQECLYWFLTLPWCLAGKDAQKGPLLFDDLPPSSSADSGKEGSLLFDGLPPASSSDPASSATKQISSEGSQEKGQKRKSLEEEEEKNGREELVEKKVCKGFQTV